MVIEPINLLPKKRYSAGDESLLLDQKNHIQLTNGDEITSILRDLTFGELPDLTGKIPDKQLFDLLVTTSKLKKSMLMGLYKNEDDVRTYYDVLLSENHQTSYLVIFSFGETQPSKFTLQFESIWPVLDQEK